MENTTLKPVGKNSVGWIILYIACFIVLPKLFGYIPGLIAAVIIIFGTYKIAASQTLTKNKKILYSILVCVGSVLLAFILSIVFIMILL